jgi:hypothetical protein
MTDDCCKTRKDRTEMMTLQDSDDESLGMNYYLVFAFLAMLLIVSLVQTIQIGALENRAVSIASGISSVQGSYGTGPTQQNTRNVAPTMVGGC